MYCSLCIPLSIDKAGWMRTKASSTQRNHPVQMTYF